MKQVEEVGTLIHKTHLTFTEMVGAGVLACE